MTGHTTQRQHLENALLVETVTRITSRTHSMPTAMLQHE
jgi:hypothetical protein